MKKDSVKLGVAYAAKVSGNVVPVRLDKPNPHGGWDGVNLTTKKAVRIKSAQRLRGLWPKKTMPIVADKVAKAADANRLAAREGLEDSERSLARTVATQLAMGTTDATEPPVAVTGKRVAKKAASGEPKPQRNSLLNLAAKVLAESSEPLNCKEMVEKVLATGLWKSDGKTPSATLYSAVLREVQTKGEQTRFRKTERGKFVATTTK